MKILYFSPHPHINMSAPSGPGTHIREVINGFETAGHTVIKCIVGGTELERTDAISFKKRSWKKWIPNYVWQSLKDYSLIRLDKKLKGQLIELIQKEKPDFIYERAYYLMCSGYEAAKLSSVKYACEINAPYPEEKSAMSGKSLFLARAIRNEKLQVDHSDKVFVVSSALKDYLQRHDKKESSKIVVTPNAVNPAHIRQDMNQQTDIKQRAGIEEGDIVIGFVGSIFPYHGVDILIEAFAALKKSRRESVKLLIVGDGEILIELKNKCASDGIAAHVHFTGNVPHAQVYDYIAVMDFTIMARSNWYGSPVKIFEYGIMKKCIIAPDVIPVQDVMKNMEDGFLIQDTSTSLLHALEFLLNHPTEVKRMSENFYNKVLSQHTWQQVSERIVEEMQ